MIIVGKNIREKKSEKSVVVPRGSQTAGSEPDLAPREEPERRAGSRTRPEAGPHRKPEAGLDQTRLEHLGPDQTGCYLCSTQDNPSVPSRTFPVLHAKHSLCSKHDIPCVPGRTFFAFQAGHSVCSLCSNSLCSKQNITCGLMTKNPHATFW